MFIYSTKEEIKLNIITQAKTYIMEKQEMEFYGHIKNMSETRLTRTIIQYMESITNMNWITEAHKETGKESMIEQY